MPSKVAAKNEIDPRVMLRVVTAVRRGDFSARLPATWTGNAGKVASALNDVIESNQRLERELRKLGRHIGKEGQAKRLQLGDAGGAWASTLDSVNDLIDDLVQPNSEMARVISAVANGDLSQTMPTAANERRLHGQFLETAKTVNTMVNQLRSFSSEVTRVAREVGTEGKLGGQAHVRGVGGVWKDLTDNVNFMASNLTSQVRNIAEVTTAVANGDLSKKITVDVEGEILELKNTVNVMVDQLNAFAGEVTRVAHEVGTEGKLGGQADVKGVAGVWKELTENVNSMAGNLTGQVRNIADVTTAVANGDLSRKITVDARGEILDLKETVNLMVDQLNGLASEVTRVTREVGTQGKLGGQADVKGVGGVWKELVDNINFMNANFSDRARNIAEVITAVANGDLSKKITVEVQGELLDQKRTINLMVDQLNAFAGEVTRVAREVGTEGRLGGQAEVRGVAGVWKDLTDNVNFMAGNLTSQVRNIAEVTTAVANGDLSKKITVDVRGEILELKQTVNLMVDQLNAFAGEVTRVAREVGTEGRLGGQAEVKGVGGVWKDLTDNVNSMAGNLTGQVRNIADVTTAVANGDLSRKITVDVRGEILELKNTVNIMVDQLNAFAGEVTRVAREVGTEGKLGGQADVKGVGGVWKDLTDNVNFMAGNLTSQVRNIAEVTTAVANGDLSKKITVDVRGEILELKNTVNLMVDQLNAFAGEVTRVAHEVGTEGKLGGQAQVKGVGGVWKELTENVNTMAANLTNQVRGIARVVTAVANGNLKGKLTLEAKGEIAELADTINNMTDTLAVFADQVTSVAREVGVEGRLGGQARVPGASGTWRDLTDNVNQLSATLTTQVRAIAEVATAVTKGDLTQSIGVDASGEVAILKDNINEMIGNLKSTTEKNLEQDWLKTNLARFTRMLQGQRDPMTVSKMILSELAPLVNAEHGVFYGVVPPNGRDAHLAYQAGYAYKPRKNVPTEFQLGEGLVGQAAVEKRPIVLVDVPSDYVRISSGLGEGKPLNIIILPVLFEGDTRAVIELASFQRFSPVHQDFLNQLTESIGIVLNTIEANSRTEDLLKQSQSLANELQSQQDQLQSTNLDLAEKARQLAQQNTEIEQRRSEVEGAKELVEEKAEQLAITSRYKSEFLANMSHELRTPLNSLLILAQELADNPDRNLLPKQVEYATIIRSSGTDLLKLINDILDLTKIESGTVALEITDWPMTELPPLLERTFRHVAEATRLGFTIDLRPGLPKTIPTDPQRLQQILNNLLSNAFKFTESGRVAFSAEPVTSGWSADNISLSRAEGVIALSVADTGIGIPAQKHQSVFEAFAQGDGTTSRKYGGTGLGLSICRELTSLLGGEIKLHSEVGKGSTFTVYLPTSLPASGGHANGGSSNGSSVRATESVWEDAAAPESWKSESPGARSAGSIKISGAEKTILVVEDDPVQRQHIVGLMEPINASVTAVSTGEEALALLADKTFDCVVLDLGLPGLTGWQVIDYLKANQGLKATPLLVYTAKNLTRKEEQRLGRSAKSIVIKEVRSPERLREEVTAILDMTATADVPVEIASGNGDHIEASLANKKVIVVDDDVRNIFALTAMLERQHMDVISVDSGKEAVEAIEKDPDIDIALVDIMMPEMDGYETMTKMRQMSTFKDRPIIALTAKAMKGDREKCIEAGASDYIAKPVNNSNLLAMLRSWLSL
ncbi:MAG TPA: HAMP domain-containing protein [Candidatus Dormibacteraeota bacterium]|jgi:HAMP domain-containing protein/signal transduction histidine kinase/DNA-binding response OmpR family regulator